MVLMEGKARDVKIAYIGGGSRGWARGLMSDLAVESSMCGTVYLYDIDYDAAKANEIIGNMFSEIEECKSQWRYKAVETLKESLMGADFVVISILPATFDEMESDVHAPEKYGIYQSVGDTTGPGGIMRALRTIPMYKVIAEAIKEYCPDAWVINYTNPMTMCMSALYKFFPKIKAFGCCHEVFATQKLIGQAYEEKHGVQLNREQVNINVVGINHFTWITDARFGNENLWDLYAEFSEKYYEDGFGMNDNNWMNSGFGCRHRVKFDLFKRYGAIAAAGDRHLAEFCPGKWYLSSKENAFSWGFGLTSIEWRRASQNKRIEKTEKLLKREDRVHIENTGEEGVHQMKAILGLAPIVTNVNLPNDGQISNLPKGFIVETNASFSPRGVRPIVSGSLPKGVDNLVQRGAYNQELTVEAAITGNYELAFKAFVNDPLMTCSHLDARKLFEEMLRNTSKYLPDCDKYINKHVRYLKEL